MSHIVTFHAPKIVKMTRTVQNGQVTFRGFKYRAGVEPGCLVKYNGQMDGKKYRFWAVDVPRPIALFLSSAVDESDHSHEVGGVEPWVVWRVW